jgi:hypothetical protein
LNLFKRIYRDPLIRRFLVACVFAGAFVWVAVDSFDVEIEVVLDFFLLSIGMVVVLIALALLFAASVHLLRKLLARASEGKRE